MMRWEARSFRIQTAVRVRADVFARHGGFRLTKKEQKTIKKRVKKKKQDKINKMKRERRARARARTIKCLVATFRIKKIINK